MSKLNHSQRSSSETPWPIKLKFYVEPACVVALKLCSQYLGHMTKLAVMPIYGKNPSNWWDASHETWYVAPGVVC